MGFLRNLGLVGLLGVASCVGGGEKDFDRDYTLDLYNSSEKPLTLRDSREKIYEDAQWVIDTKKELWARRIRKLGFELEKIPEIRLECLRKEVTGLEEDCMGLYYPELDIVSVDPEAISREHFLGDYYLNVYVVHEVIHHCLDELSEEYYGKNFSHACFGKANKTGMVFVSEGLAQHFQEEYFNTRSKFSWERFPKTLEGFSDPEVKYYGGAFWVGPLVDEFGIRAVIYLLDNYPYKKEDLLDLRSYQEKIRSDLLKGQITIDPQN